MKEPSNIEEIPPPLFSLMNSGKELPPPAGDRGYTSNERGFALLLVLVVVSIMGYLVFDFSYLVRVDLNSAENFRNGSKAYALAKSGIEACRALRREDNNDWDSLDELWATERPPVMVEGGLIEVQLTDESSKLNINNLATEAEYEGKQVYPMQFYRLFTILGYDERIVDNIIDWIDEDNNGPAENDYYLHLQPPYECKNGKMDTIYELLLVRGITDEMFYGNNEKPGLVDLITVTQGRQVNINTAGPEVLQSLHEDLTLDIAYNIIRSRQEKPFKLPSDLNSREDEIGLEDHIWTDIQSYIIVKGEFFLARSIASVGDYNVRVQALIERSGRNIYYWKRY